MRNTIPCNTLIPNSNPTNKVKINIGRHPIINPVINEVFIIFKINPAKIFNNTCPAIIFAIYKFYSSLSLYLMEGKIYNETSRYLDIDSYLIFEVFYYPCEWKKPPHILSSTHLFYIVL